MRYKYLLVVIAFMATGLSAQVVRRVNVRTNYRNITNAYMDSLKTMKAYIDSTVVVDDNDPRYAQLFTTLTFYHHPAEQILRLDKSHAPSDSLQAMLDRTLMDIYLRRPDLVIDHESRLDAVGSPFVPGPETGTEHVYQEIVEQVAPQAIEPTVDVVDIYVAKPKFWTITGEYYLQFLQNYVSSNWYKGGESSYSMLGSVTMEANYDNKEKLKWDNKLELKLGFQAANGDSIHHFKSSEDLIRYTSKLGLQATKKWYYTLQLIAYTQFTRGYKSNDPVIYSDFMSPFNANLSLGMDYKVSWLNNKLTGTINLAPLALNWRYVDRGELATSYSLDEGEHSMLELGSEMTLDLTWKISDNISWKSRLYGYTTYKRAELEWENTFTFKFNRYISSNLFVYPRFDDGATRDDDHGYWQLKEYCSIGFTYSF